MLITKSIAPIGLMFTCIAIVTGSIWGQPTWGTFWAWDARITSMVILALFYFLLIAVHKLISDEDKANKISSVIAAIGLINIPIIKYSVEWWSTLHQPASPSAVRGPGSGYRRAVVLPPAAAGSVQIFHSRPVALPLQ